MDHFDEFRYAVQARCSRRDTRDVTFRNDPQSTALPVRELGAFYLVTVSAGGGALERMAGVSRLLLRVPHSPRAALRRGFLPDNSTIQDWGVTYAELEPYTPSGTRPSASPARRATSRAYSARRNPFEGRARRNIPATNKIAYGPTLFKQATDQLGFKTFRTPTANSPGVYTNPDGQVLAPCNYCGFCERFVATSGKASPITTVVPTALASGRVEVREYSNVFRIDTASVRATSVSYFDATGQEQEQPRPRRPGAFTLSNTRLLLLSGIGQAYDPQANIE